MPLEDKTVASGASTSRTAKHEDTVAGKQQRTPLHVPAQSPDQPQADLSTDVAVQIQPESAVAVSETGAGAGSCEASVAARVTREDATVAQDDRAVKEARWKSLETLQPNVPGYEVLKKLGQGTYGVVWHAREEGTGIEVAIKFFAHGASDQWQLLQAEVKQLAMLHADPGIVHLIDVEPDATPPYFIMDYAEQGSLAKRLETGPLPLDESIKIFHRVVEALAYVHAKGVRHCDLKPGNILLDARGRPKVADFGQAHLSSDASPALGTFFYMAPEQADLDKQIPDTRWDVYGLGALWYAMITGRPPREDSSVRVELEQTERLSHRLERYRHAVVNAEPVTKHRQVAGMDRALADIISRCLEVDPEKRYHDASAILEALQRREWMRKQRPLLLFGLIAPLLLLLTLGGLGWSQGVASVAEFRVSQQRQVKADCETAARLIQSVIRNKVLEQAERVKRVADNEKISAALGVNQAIFRKEARLIRENTNGDDDLFTPAVAKLRMDMEGLGRNGFESWALVDRNGDSLVGDVFGDGFKPRDKKGGETEEAYYRRRHEARQGQEANFGKDFSWRKYFNGQRDYYERQGAGARTACFWPEHPAPDVPEVLVTNAYRNVRKKGGLSIGVAAPVYIEDERGMRTLAGVFLGNVSVKAMNKWLIETEIKDGHAVVLDAENHCLFHTGETDANGVHDPRVSDAIWPPGERTPREFVFATAAAGSAGNAVTHLDPVMVTATGEKRRYLGDSVPIIGTVDGKPGPDQLFRWTALVEQDFDVIMTPVEKIVTQMTVWGIVKLATTFVMLLGMWLWLFKRLTRQEHVSHA